MILFRKLCQSVFTGWLGLRWAPFLPRSQLLPRTGSILILSYTLQRWSLVPIGDERLAARPSVLSRPYFLGMGPSRWSKPITVLLRDPAYPPFCSSNFGPLPTSGVLPFCSFRPWYTCPHWALYTLVVSVLENKLPRRPSYSLVISNLGKLPPLSLQSIIHR
jgi:hypothetical protein